LLGAARLQERIVNAAALSFGETPTPFLTEGHRSQAKFGNAMPTLGQPSVAHGSVSVMRSRCLGSGFHIQDDFQFDRRTEWQARNTNDKARRDRLFAENISEQLRRGISDLRV